VIEHRRQVIVWAGVLCTAATAFAALLHRPPWLFVVSVIVAGAALVLLVAAGTPDLVAWVREQRRAARERRRNVGPAVMGRWRQTTDGIEAASASMALQRHFGHPAYQSPAAGTEPPRVRVAVLVASDPLGERPAADQLRRTYLELLAASPINDLVTRLTHVGPGLSWQSYAGNQRMTLGAVLAADANDDKTPPVATAFLLLNDGSGKRHGQDQRYAEISILIEAQDDNGHPRPPDGVDEWHARLVTALKVPAAFVSFMETQLGVRTHSSPTALLGLALEAHPNLTALLDTAGLRRLPGSTSASTFYHYVFADTAGTEPARVASDVLRVWYEAVRVEGVETELGRLAGEP
jgi:hypothetical protein